jgi:hypothetical protein
MAMLKAMSMIALAAAPLAWAAPALAQNAAQNGVLLIYGEDKCPTNTSGEEIVVCQRLDESERYRIPKDVREIVITPQNESWAVRQETALEAGDFGVGSCTTVGPASATGCFVKEATIARRETRARQEAATNLPLP